MEKGGIITENKVVLFADILGFAALIESYPLDVDRCRLGNRPLIYHIAEVFEPSRNELARIFSDFHSSLSGVLMLARLHSDLTAISFSDSVFVATTYVYESVNISINLLHASLQRKILIRMGIGYGTFATLRFRSDVTADGGDHAAQFLGTAVVRAHAAETCGIKGLRILLHPSVMPLLDDSHHNPVPTEKSLHPLRDLECAQKEQVNRTGVLREIDYWHLRPTEEAKSWQGLQDMWNEAPLAEAEHYEATAEAINRMRISQGHKPLNKLRRRTLPR